MLTSVLHPRHLEFHSEIFSQKSCSQMHINSIKHLHSISHTYTYNFHSMSYYNLGKRNKHWKMHVGCACHIHMYVGVYSMDFVFCVMELNYPKGVNIISNVLGCKNDKICTR